ncbi:hypothetical protein AIX81_21625 [Salmonella enterica]|nr:hypothetical protein [Salmonella enterica]
MSHHIEGLGRYQATMFPELLDDFITEDNPVRVVDVFVDRLAAVIRLNAYRQAIIQHPKSFHDPDHILAFQRFSGMDRQTFPTKIIHYSQRPKTPPVKQIIRQAVDS